MKKILLFALLIFAIASCDSEANTTNASNERESRVTEEIMEQLIDDLLVGTCVPKKCKEMLGDECIKDWDDIPLGSYRAKYGDYGINNPIVFYNDGTCRIGYKSDVYSSCPLAVTDPDNHPAFLYDTWFWECDFQKATITFTSKLEEQNAFAHIAKIAAYKEGELVIDGNIPNIISGKSTLAYKCIINDAKA